MGPSATIFRISKSSVPCRSSDFSSMPPSLLDILHMMTVYLYTNVEWVCKGRRGIGMSEQFFREGEEGCSAIPELGRPCFQGGIAHPSQLSGGRSGRGLYGNPLHNRGKVTRQVRRGGCGRQLALLLRLPQTLKDEPLGLTPAENQFFSNRFRPVATGQSSGDGQTSGSLFRTCYRFHHAVQEPFDKCAGGRFLRRLAHIDHHAVGVTIERLAKKILFIAEGRIHARTINAHRFGQLGKGSSFIALATKDFERAIQS